MSDNYSSDFKAKVALDAVSQGRSVIAEVAEKYDVTEEEVISWASTYHEEGATVFAGEQAHHGHSDSEVEDVDITTEDNEFAHAVEHGVMDDDLNYKKLIFWSTLGTALVIIFVIGLVYFSQYSIFESQQEASLNSEYIEVQELNAAQTEKLNSFGVVDGEEGIYRIPIDSAIKRIAVD
ncbi:MAG: hypothetical protein FH748_13255 [Balneolaceae bacterium]|nr:hypothetical protein [Balneolaceae bacterium]